MADLKKFIYSGLKTGENIDLYLNRFPKIGHGKADVVESLHLKLTGEGSVLGKKFTGTIEIIMPDTSSQGVCTVIVNGSKSENCPYKVLNAKLQINHPSTQITVYDHDKKWTWVHINHPISVWIGIWPSGKNMETEDCFGEPR